MIRKYKRCFYLAVFVLGNQLGLSAQQQAPAYPLITHDPYFSIWSTSDTLNQSVTKHWTGTEQSLIGIIKVDDKLYRFLGKEEHPMNSVLPTSEEDDYKFQYTETAPEGDWMNADYNDKQWKTGQAPAGDGADANLKWTSKDLWTRRTFSLKNLDLNKLFLKINHDDNVDVFLNGKKIYSKIGWLNKFDYIPISDEVKNLLSKRDNVLAIHVVNTAGRQWLDAGISEAPSPTVTTTVNDAVQNKVTITATQTQYDFTCGAVKLKVTFTSPLLMNDLDLLSRPVSYISCKASAIDQKQHDVKVSLAVSTDIAVNTAGQKVSVKKLQENKLMLLKAGTLSQSILAKRGDDVRIDWGYLYVAVPEDKSSTQFITGSEANDAFAVASNSDSLAGRNLQLHTILSFGKIGTAEKEKFFMVAYDDIYSIQYFKTNLQPWWKHGNATILTELSTAANQYKSVISQCDKFDKSMHALALKSGGEKYAKLCDLAYRQSIAAHKLVKSPDGELLFLSKENYSNGCINTVDVTYPSAPLFLLYNPELMKGMLNGVFYFSESGKYTKPYAAHDLGTYPLANGQAYGEGMPVEESGNMLILTGAIAKAEKNASYAKKHWATLTTWANYLLTEGFDPDKQLCTDDFAGHLARNANLSVKAIIGLESYGMLAAQLSYKDIAKKFKDTALSMAKRWEEIADAGDHYALTFNNLDTWSQKYNMVWDKVLGFNLFSKDVYAKEVKFYLSHQNDYGLPLDSRKTYTKSDWITWSACLTSDKNNFQKFIDPLYKYITETKSRVPLCDWHETTDGKQVGFQARSVVGGYFMKVLMDQWSNRK